MREKGSRVFSLYAQIFSLSSLNVCLYLTQVGFLKTQHRYEIVFTLPEVPALGKDVCPAPVPNPHLRITDMKPTPEGKTMRETRKISLKGCCVKQTIKRVGVE